MPVRVIGATLRHPISLALKRPLKNAAWWWRARNLANPLLRARPRSILFLCLGNICRSPFAAHLAARRLADSFPDIRCTSGGLRASQAAQSPAEAVEVAAAYGVALEAHRPVDVTPAELDAADVIVVMEVRHVEEVRRRAPSAAARVHLLPLYEPNRARYGALERVNLLDPFGQGRAAFVHCYARVDAAVRGLIEVIGRAGSGVAP